MPISQVDVGNAALAKIGQDVRMSAFSDPTKAARVVSSVWNRVLGLVLAEHPWPWTMAAVALSVDADPPFPGWVYRYAQPANCLSAIAVCSAEGVRATVAIASIWDWALRRDSFPVADGRVPFDTVYGTQNTCIVSDLACAYLVYSARVIDVSRFPDLFVEALACRLAAEIAPSLAGEVGIKMGNGLVQMYEVARAKAIAHDLNAYRDDVRPTTPALASRGGY